MSWMNDWEAEKDDREDAFAAARRRPCPDPEVHHPHVYRAFEQSWQCPGRIAPAPNGFPLPEQAWRLSHAAIAMEADTADGTFLAFGPDINLPRLAKWFDRLDHDKHGGYYRTMMAITQSPHA